MNELFPYKPRKYQKEIIEIVENCLKNKENLVLEAPAGTGKTICVLTPCISFAKENDMGIVYLTRTNSQQKQAIVELKRLAEKIDIKAVGIQGKTNMCLLIENIPSLRDKKISNDELSKICSARKKRSMEALKGKREWNRCLFFENFMLTKDALNFDGIFSAEEILEYCRKNGICAYEMNKLFVKDAEVVIAPYIYIFDEFLREKFIVWYSYPFEKTILIIDEAHNLPEFCRELLSFSLSLNTIRHAINEADEYGVRDKDVLFLLKTMENIFELLQEEIDFSETDDALLADKKLEEELAKEGIDKDYLQEIADKMIIYGEVVADIKESKNLLPRSFIRSVGNFFIKWLD
ncbi:MAG TPA: DEAD/DEAH box helicase, partial [Thermoplasmatales archaeon]|nr:DEAD/DEAH box helicase [Thermoplasmatales archaeon]